MAGRFFADRRSEARALMLPDAAADRRLVENLEEKLSARPGGVAARKPAPEVIEKIECGFRIGELKRAELVARMHVETDAETKPDQTVDGAVEFGKIRTHTFGATERFQQALGHDRQAYMR